MFGDSNGLDTSIGNDSDGRRCFGLGIYAWIISISMWIPISTEKKWIFSLGFFSSHFFQCMLGVSAASEPSGNHIEVLVLTCTSSAMLSQGS